MPNHVRTYPPKVVGLSSASNRACLRFGRGCPHGAVGFGVFRGARREWEGTFLPHGVILRNALATQVLHEVLAVGAAQETQRDRIGAAIYVDKQYCDSLENLHALSEEQVFVESKLEP